MKKRISSIVALAVALCMTAVLIPNSQRNVEAGAVAELFGIESDFGGFIVDNTYDNFAIGSLSDWGESAGSIYRTAGQGANVVKYRPERAAFLVKYGNRLTKLSNGLRLGGQVLNVYNTGTDTYKFFTETSKHETMFEKGIDKTLLAVDVGMGWYSVGAAGVALFTAPAWGTGLAAAAAAVGTGFVIKKIGVGLARVAFNSETYRNASRYVRRSFNNAVDFVKGKKKLVFAPLQRPGMKEGLDIIKEELGFDLYPGLRREIPDPSTGIPVYKPNIYLYSDEDMTVKVKLFPSHLITASDPEYPKAGWTADVRSGSLNASEDFLFYEAMVPDTGFQKAEGFRVSSHSLAEDMTRIMKEYSFSEKETIDFIEYWQQKLDDGKKYIFLPQETDTVDSIMPLVLSEQPDNIYRIWFYIIEDDGRHIKPACATRIKRDGFAVVEWGGVMK